jgi:DNA polymerase III alpha subunit (gram-positive type)
VGLTASKPQTTSDTTQTPNNNSTEITEEQLWNNIQNNTDLTQARVWTQARKIHQTLGSTPGEPGFISDKAAIIQASRQLGANLKQLYNGNPPGKPELDIENIHPQMFSVEIQATVTKIQTKNTFDGGQVRSIIIKDQTGKTQVTAWDDDTVVWDQFEQGDRIAVEGGYTNQEISDYQQDRFGVPAIQLGDDAVVARDTGEGWDEYEL